MQTKPIAVLILAVGFLSACDRDASNREDAAALDRISVQDTSARVAVVTGFSGPEAVRYDPEADVYFVSNFNGGGGDRDANGFISRVAPDGTVEAAQFMVGTDAAALHAPRGMFIVGDTLSLTWTASTASIV